MRRISIHLSHVMLDRVRRHLLSSEDLCEEAAFLFARARSDNGSLDLDVVEVMTIAPDGFTSRSRFYLELTDATRAAVIKRGHDLGAGLIECHSHPVQRNACFSWSDLHGFDEFVPHVLWRLKDRPYAAIVVASDSFDAIVWSGGVAEPESLDGIVTNFGVQRPTGLTLANWSDIYERRPL